MAQLWTGSKVQNQEDHDVVKTESLDLNWIYLVCNIIMITRLTSARLTVGSATQQRVVSEERARIEIVRAVSQ